MCVVSKTKGRLGIKKHVPIKLSVHFLVYCCPPSASEEDPVRIKKKYQFYVCIVVSVISKSFAFLHL